MKYTKVDKRGWDLQTSCTACLHKYLLTCSQRSLKERFTEFPRQAVKMACEIDNQYPKWKFQEKNGVLMGFLQHFDMVVEIEPISCKNAVICTPIRMETYEK